MNDLFLMDIKHKLKTQDIFRGKTVKALVDQIETLKRNQAEETAEFNAGYEAAQRDEPIENEPSHTPYDVWRIGWAWGSYQKANQVAEQLTLTPAE